MPIDGVTNGCNGEVNVFLTGNIGSFCILLNKATLPHYCRFLIATVQCGV